LNDAACCNAGVRSRHRNTINATLYDNPKFNFVRDNYPGRERPASVPGRRPQADLRELRMLPLVAARSAFVLPDSTRELCAI
jgi:hypothetical protein